MTSFKSCNGYGVHMLCILFISICLTITSKAGAQSGEYAKSYFISPDAVKADADNDGIPDLIGDTVRVSGTASIATGQLHEKFMQIFI